MEAGQKLTPVPTITTVPNPSSFSSGAPLIVIRSPNLLTWSAESTFGTSIAAAPLVAYHFGLFTPYAPLLTVLLLPLVALVLAPAYVSMALAWCGLPNTKKKEK